MNNVKELELSVSERKRRRQDEDLDLDFFRSYGQVDIHESMVGDTVRTAAYQGAILRNYHLFRGKVVADVGAGTGILSVFCAHAGARKVYAIEASEMAHTARDVVRENGLEDRIEVLHGRAEDLTLPQTVDIVVSEWMGYFLLYETMLPSVLNIRDRFLRPGGTMLPSEATIYLAPFTDRQGVVQDRMSFWKKAGEKYKVKLSSVEPLTARSLTENIDTHCLEGRDIMAHAATVKHFDLSAVTAEQLASVQSSFEFRMHGHCTVHGLVGWFDVGFPGGSRLSTSPYDPVTHWGQSAMFLPEAIPAVQDTLLAGTIRLTQNPRHRRFLDVGVDLAVDGGEARHYDYHMT